MRTSLLMKKRPPLGGGSSTPLSIGWRTYMAKYYQFYLMLIPVVLFYIVFKYAPMYGILIAFKDYSIFRGVGDSPWVGFEVFRRAFEQPSFWRAVRNTINLNLLSLVVGFPAPIIYALLLNEVRSRRLKRTVQSISYLPHFFSWVVVYGILLAFLNPHTGLITGLLNRLGADQIPFLTDVRWWLSVYVGSGIWKGVGWAAIIYISALSAIDPELYDAAHADGAGFLRSTWHVTLPGIRPTILIILIINLGTLFNIGFEQPFLLGNAHVNRMSTVLSVHIYRLGLLQSQFSLTTAIGVFQSAINFTLLLAVNRLARVSGERGIW